MRFRQYRIIDNIFQNTFRILKCPVQRRCNSVNTLNIALFRLIVILIQNFTIQNQLFINKVFYSIFSVSIIYRTLSKLKNIAELCKIIFSVGAQIVIIQFGRNIFVRQMRNNIKNCKPEICCSHRVFTVNNRFTDQPVRYTLRIEFIFTDI